MNPNSNLTSLLIALASFLVVVLAGRRLLKWNRLRREELLRQQAELDAALARSAVPRPEQPARPVVSGQAAFDAPLPHTPGWAAKAQLPEDARPEPHSPSTSPSSSSEVIRPERFQSWSAPEVKTWQPPSQEVYQVSWGNRQLFGDQEEHFEEPAYIPKVTPDQVPVTSTEDYAFGTATPVMAALMPVSQGDLVGQELKQAGFYQPHAMQNLQATRFALLLGTVLLLGGLLVVVPKRAEVPVLMSMLIVPGLMWAVPRVLIQNRATNRRSELERAMPDMLDMLNMCVSQGLTIPSALKRISVDLRPVYPVLAQELGIVVHQSGIGNLHIALDNFAKRVDVPEVDSFVSLMNQSERMGTSVSDALTEYSNTMRESLRQRTDEKANKASFKLMFPTVLFMMPAVFMFLLGPAILELQVFNDRGGMDALRQDAEQLENMSNITQVGQ